MRERVRRPRLALLVVAVFHAVSPLVLVGLPFWFEQDETVYISQVSRSVPAGFFTPPRARGMTFLVAPIAQLTTSSSAIRIYLALLSGVGLYLAFRPWLRARPGYAAPVAALLFSIVWTTVYYGYEALPNLYVAIAAVGATGYAVLVLHQSARRSDWWLLVVWVTVAGLMRPADAVYLCAGMAIATVMVRGPTRRTRATVGSALLAGLVAGWLEWVIEAYVSYGGLPARLRASSAENGGGFHFSLLLQAKALSGPTLCRPCTHAVEPHAVAWWFLVPPLVALGCYAAACRHNVVTAVVPLFGGLALLAEYVITVNYAAPRFLTPVYALLSLPAGEGVCWLATRRWRAWHPRLAVPVLGALIAGQFASEAVVLRTDVLPPQRAFRAQYLNVIHDVAALSPPRPCLVLGTYAPPIAFGLQCSDVPTDVGRPGETTIMLTERPAGRHAYFATWPRYRLQGSQLLHSWYAYIDRSAQPR